MVTDSCVFKFDKRGRSIPCSEVREMLNPETNRKLIELRAHIRRGY